MLFGQSGRQAETLVGCCYTFPSPRLPIIILRQISIKIYKSNTPTSMIDGLPLRDIHIDDYYRRFIVLSLLIKRARDGSSSKQVQDARRYEQIEKEFQMMEEQLRSKSSNGVMREGETIVKIDDLHSNLEHIIAKTKYKKQAFQGDLLAKWRAALIVKKRRELQSKKDKDAKSTSNKNLMYLTSQMLRKQRISEDNIRCHYQKMNRVNSNMQGLLKEADLQFKLKYDQLREAIRGQRIRIEGVMEEYRQSLQAQRLRFQSQCQQKMGYLKQQLKKERELFQSNMKGIKEILQGLNCKH